MTFIIAIRIEGLPLHMPAKYHTAEDFINTAQLFFAIVISIFEFALYKLRLPQSIECGECWEGRGPQDRSIMMIIIPQFKFILVCCQ